MKHVKKVVALSVALALVGGALGALALQHDQANKTEAATNLGAVKYLAVNDTNFYKDNNSFGKGGTGVGELTSGRRETFHGDRRSYNALDNFINTMAKTGEGETGWIRSNEWVHTGGYISFLMGGNSSCYVNIWAEPENELPGENVVEGIHTDFYASHDAYNADYENGLVSDFELSANMALKYFQIPDRLIGRRMIVFMEDNATGYYGGIQFGDLRVNQSLEEVARTFSTHKQQIALDAQLTKQNEYSADYMLNTYYADTTKYGALITAEAALNNADEGFEEYGLTNWAYDRYNSTVDINFAGAVSSDDAKAGFGERMPANKSGNFYFNADSSIDLFNGGEDHKYRLVSNEFTLSGNGFISAKLGGGTAVLSLIDSTGAELATTRCAAAEGTNILNPVFHDSGSVANIVENGGRFNTMTRVILDASTHLGKKVRIAISDDRTGGNWGLAYFDEIVTKYDSLPTLRVDRIQQQYNDTPTYCGVVTDKYFGSLTTTFGKAYDFVQRYYAAMRNVANGASWCTIANNQTVTDLLDEYDALDSDVKALVNAAQDYDFGSAATSTDWFLQGPANITTVEASIIGVKSSVGGGSPAHFGLLGLNSDTSVEAGIVVTSTVVAISLVLFLFFVAKKRKEQR